MWGILADAISRVLPEQRDILHLSWALADPNRLEHLMASAGFRDIHVKREKREDIIESFDNYWAPIENGYRIYTAGIFRAQRTGSPLGARGSEGATFAVRVERAATDECRDADRQRASLDERFQTVVTTGASRWLTAHKV
jgi:hypothetical protein